MAAEVDVQIKVSVTGLEDAVELIDSLKDVASKSSKEVNKLTNSEKAFKKLDSATGGLASGFLEIGKAAKKGGKAMKSALVSSGIGAVVVLLGTIVDNWDNIKSLVDGVDENQDRLLEGAEDLVDVRRKELESLNLSENTLKLQGKTEREIRALKIQQTEEIIKATEALLIQQRAIKTTQIEAAERNKNITMGILGFINKPYEAILYTVDKVSAALVSIGAISEKTNLVASMNGALESVAELLFDPEEVSLEGDKVIEETELKLSQLKSKRDGYKLQDLKESARIAKEQSKLREKEDRDKERLAEKERKRLEKQIELEQQALNDKYDRLALLDQALQTAEENEIQSTVQKYETLLALADEFGFGEAELLKKRNAEIEAINAKHRAKEEAANSASEEKKLMTKGQKIQAGFDLANAALNLMQALQKDSADMEEEEARKAFKRGKAMQIAGAIMSTAQAVIGALNPAMGGLGFPAGLPGAITAGLTGAAQIATISKQKFSGGGGSGTAGISSGASITPSGGSPDITSALIPENFTPSATTPTNQELSPTKAYVVGTEITTQQQLDLELSHRATL